jgi:hypothetical protein
MSKSWDIGVISKVRFICTGALCRMILSISVAKRAFQENIGFAGKSSFSAPLAY